MARTTDSLRRRGLGQGDVVASVLPSGPDAFTAALAAFDCATFAPLPAEAQRAQYESLFLELTPKVLLIHPGANRAARDAARNLQIPLIDVYPAGEAGRFELAGRTGYAPAPERPPSPGDLVLIVKASPEDWGRGDACEEGRPRLVPLSRQILDARLKRLLDRLSVHEEDRCLNFSPLHELSGIESLLAALIAGGSAVCPPDIQTARFFEALTEFQPTWFFATTRELRTILRAAAVRTATLEQSHIRLIHARGTRLPAKLAKSAGAAFHARVVLDYGRAEANISSECATWDSARPGAATPEVGEDSTLRPNEIAILAEDGRRGQFGEIAVRGSSVVASYFRDQAGSLDAFHNGWFHTGDLGGFDGDGRLVITGQARQLIYCGRTRVSPVEVDEVLLAHPDVADAVTFPVPRTQFEEEVAAAVVLRPGASVTASALRSFAATHLLTHQIPRHIWFVDKMPGPRRDRWSFAPMLELDGKAVFELQRDAVVALQSHGDGLPLFLISPGNEARALAGQLGPDHPIFGIRRPDLRHIPPPHTIEHTAAACVCALRRFRPRGPYALAGWHDSAIVALEMARLLEDEGEEVAFVCLVDECLPRSCESHPGSLRDRLGRFARGLLGTATRRDSGPGSEQEDYTAPVLEHYRSHPWSSRAGPGRVLHVNSSAFTRARRRDPERGPFELDEVATVERQPPVSSGGKPDVGAAAEILAAELDRADATMSR